MNKKSFKLIGLLSLIAATILLVACQSETKSKTSKSQEVQWGYTGITGPEHWGDLSKDYELSKTGKEQSPINITGAEDVDFPELNLNNQESEGQVENELDGKTYTLVGHFVYKTYNGKIAVVSVLYNYGDKNQALQLIWDKMPQAANTETDLSQAISPDDFYPENKVYCNFEGSLTTPPCTEGVNWIVFKSQETVSKEQVEKFSQTLGFENNRPIQDANGRKIKA